MGNSPTPSPLVRGTAEDPTPEVDPVPITVYVDGRLRSMACSALYSTNPSPKERSNNLDLSSTCRLGTGVPVRLGVGMASSSRVLKDPPEGDGISGYTSKFAIDGRRCEDGEVYGWAGPQQSSAVENLKWSDGSPSRTLRYFLMVRLPRVLV